MLISKKKVFPKLGLNKEFLNNLFSTYSEFNLNFFSEY